MKPKNVINVCLVLLFIGTIGIYFHIKRSKALQKNRLAEMGSPEIPGFQTFFDVDRDLVNADGKTSYGNNLAAGAIAEDFHRTLRQDLKAVPELAELNDAEGIIQRVYTLLHESREGDLNLKHLVFIVYIPELEGLDESISNRIVDIAWAAAQTEAGQIKGHPTLALALRGENSYGTICVGSKKAEPLI